MPHACCVLGTMRSPSSARSNIVRRLACSQDASGRRLSRDSFGAACPPRPACAQPVPCLFSKLVSPCSLSSKWSSTDYTSDLQLVHVTDLIWYACTRSVTATQYEPGYVKLSRGKPPRGVHGETGISGHPYFAIDRGWAIVSSGGKYGWAGNQPKRSQTPAPSSNQHQLFESGNKFLCLRVYLTRGN